MSWFKAFRMPSGETWYDEQHVSVSVDVRQVAVIFASAVISAAMLVSVIGIRGREKWSTFLRVLYSLFIFITILVTVFGQDWQFSSLRSKCPYKIMSTEDIHADINVNIGLNSVNVSLAATLNLNSSTRHIYYNERFSWIGVNQAEKEYEDALTLGAPSPILLVAEYISVDKGGLRWHRAYRQSGYFTYIMLWAAFAFWALANCLLCMVVFYGACLVVITGMTLTSASFLYHMLQPGHRLTIPMEDGFIVLSYGWCFWLTMAAGVLTIFVGICILVMEECVPDATATFFLLDSSTLDTDDKYLAARAQTDVDTDLRVREAIKDTVTHAKPKFSYVDMSKVGDGVDSSTSTEVDLPRYYTNMGYVPSETNLTNITEEAPVSRRFTDSDHSKNPAARNFAKTLSPLHDGGIYFLSGREDYLSPRGSGTSNPKKDRREQTKSKRLGPEKRSNSFSADRTEMRTYSPDASHYETIPKLFRGQESFLY
ncbi:dual oxidase maturation factor 1 [Lingula anatina]|uniref:Dual oxidase maturation factor 1 n=1 Tax=Lingula anatina TaxID=7574 RepID=A0A1S3HTY1_LINAN|nr:dual oxidase maturation factor 1 [Lingula anatina]XP_013389002.1 dual oxidase maturation factor 1 [Lingula anatina]XP_013389005.1 dual oxidase maturation factor 1 [Lingula anatina]XP_013389006.1 dual oxidase maturation factor 1 [Lingula anatina]XP_013389007.1 dual oxidase maturation factor 1 [Lingula anatina]|eukprot:XP_013389001.1 dual oxidase maturation factor 1 [Lingula anatina]